MVKTRTWIIIFGVLLAVCVGVSVLVFCGPAGRVANIYRDGQCIYSVDLSRVAEAYEMTFEDERGSNVVRVEPGRIAVIRADCPDQVCVHDGWLADSGAPIVCLPHRLVIRLEKEAMADGVAR